MADPLLEARIRARRYWYRDGLSEIPLGIVMLLMAGEDLLSILSKSTLTWYLAIYVGSIAMLALFATRIMAAVRGRVRYPRSGYVPDSGRGRRVVAGMITGLVIVVASVMFVGYERDVGWDPNRWFQWLSVAGGLANAVMGVYVTVRYGLLRFLIVGLFALILSFVVSIEYAPRLSITIWLAGVGCAWLCSGSIAIWNYIRAVPRSVDAT